MSKRSQQKRQARTREKAKDARRRRNANPTSLLGPESSIRCYIHGGVEDQMARLSIFRDMADGYVAFAGFLIDYRCLGVKDAYARFNLDNEDVRFIRANNSKPIATDAARNLVAAAIRWNRMHPFRLPAYIQRCLAILGGTLDIDNADTSQFGAENDGLDYLGYKSDLARALTIPLEEFLERDNVTVAFVNRGADDLDDDDDEQDQDERDDVEDPFDALSDDEAAALNNRMGDLIEVVLDRGCNILSDWAARTGRTPHPQTRMALTVFMVDGLKRLRQNGDAAGNAEGSPDSDFMLVPEDVPRDELDAALQQINQFMRENPDAELFGLPEDAAE
jgi:hypothetical protein